MPRNDLVRFVFARDWTHAGVTYAPGDAPELPANDVEKLTRLGAGTPERKTDPPKGKKAPTPSL